ncbi:hypothetical protein G7Y89_g8933 [Cudoniella acicularis]|uniref:2EXR domain-containing protein n=1 Tax=Cudoniella acicularis TaxID=354080 RepID=A0A8H4W0K5_9HELO|nr:hypothetical protein G7Y89_g8933 [Cudoniella acicularis]
MTSSNFPPIKAKFCHKFCRKFCKLSRTRRQRKSKRPVQNSITALPPHCYPFLEPHCSQLGAMTLRTVLILFSNFTIGAFRQRSRSSLPKSNYEPAHRPVEIAERQDSSQLGDRCRIPADQQHETAVESINELSDLAQEVLKTPDILEKFIVSTKLPAELRLMIWRLSLPAPRHIFLGYECHSVGYLY